MKYPLITSHHQPQALIMGDGDFPLNQVCRDILSNASLIIACDGAARSLISASRVPDFIIGDGDSMPHSLKEKYADRLIIIDDQEENDLTKATLYCMNKGFTDITYLGATGKREDHTMANISLCMRYFTDFELRPVMISDHGYFTPACGDALFESRLGMQVSIFNKDCTYLQSRGLKWRVRPFDAIWQGALNEARGDDFEIMADGNYLIYRTFAPKVMVTD